MQPATMGGRRQIGFWLGSRLHTLGLAALLGHPLGLSEATLTVV